MKQPEPKRTKTKNKTCQPFVNILVFHNFVLFVFLLLYMYTFLFYLFYKEICLRVTSIQNKLYILIAARRGRQF